MPDNQKTGPQRPPPLPKTSNAPRPGVLARVKAFLEIRRLRARDAARRLGGWTRRRPVAASLIVATVVVAAAGGGALAVLGMPDLPFFPAETMADATENARAHPSDAAAQRDLGHALWASRRRHAAIATYGRALSLDAGVADDRLVANLVGSFGGRDQREAEAFIWKHKLIGAQRGLETLIRSRRPGVRWAAVRTLDRLGRGTRANWEAAYIVNLDSPECETRRRAVDKLGEIGTPRAASALREARAEDEKTGGWFRSRCLGDRVDDAEKKVLARR